MSESNKFSTEVSNLTISILSLLYKGSRVFRPTESYNSILIHASISGTHRTPNLVNEHIVGRSAEHSRFWSESKPFPGRLEIIGGSLKKFLIKQP